MTTVYVAGPVLRNNSLHGDRRELIYRHIYRTLTDAGFKVIIPALEYEAERADPHTFFEMMRDRIVSADLVITIFPDRNRSVPVESTIASFMNKKQYVIGAELENVPRLLKGLPGVLMVASTHELDEVLNQVTDPLRDSPSIRRRGGENTSGGGENMSGGGMASI